MRTPLKTTRPEHPVISIADIVAIEARPYDELVTARNLLDLFRATALHVPERPALTVLRSEDPDDVGASLSHVSCSRRSRARPTCSTRWDRAARGRRRLSRADAATAAGAAARRAGGGHRSTLNYLLNVDALADLLNAQQATVLVVPDRTLDETCWTKGQALVNRVASLREVLVIGEAEGHRGIAEALQGCRADALDFEPSAGSRHGVRAVPHRRYDRTAQARAADPRQPDPRRLRLSRRSSATTSTTSSSTASPSSTSAERSPRGSRCSRPADTSSCLRPTRCVRRPSCKATGGSSSACARRQ
jgi:hypothetical protein